MHAYLLLDLRAVDIGEDLPPGDGVRHRVPACVLGPEDELVDVGEVVQLAAGRALPSGYTIP